jgi:hypothetical protein
MGKHTHAAQRCGRGASLEILAVQLLRRLLRLLRLRLARLGLGLQLPRRLGPLLRLGRQAALDSLAALLDLLQQPLVRSPLCFLGLADGFARLRAAM